MVKSKGTKVEEFLEITGIVLVAVDPGETCGLAMFDTTGKILSLIECDIDSMENYLDAWWPFTHLVVERWWLHPKARKYFDDLIGPQAIGIVRSWANRHDMGFERLIPSHVKKFRKEAEQFVSANPHMRDAVCVGLYWFKRHYKAFPNLFQWAIYRKREEENGEE